MNESDLTQAELEALVCGEAEVEQPGFFRVVVRLPRDILRLRLVRKARKGHYDSRMFAYYGKSSSVTDGCKRAVRRAYAHWLIPTSTTGGVHAPGSYHNPVNGIGRAVDLGVHPSKIGTAKGRRLLVRQQRREFKDWRKGKRPNLRELIGPDNNMIVLRGVHSPLADGSPLENQHDNHVHEAFV